MLNRIRILSTKLTIALTAKTQLWFSHCCVLCHLPCLTKFSLCHACINNLDWNTNCCYQCAMPLPKTQTNKYCGYCLKKCWAFERCIAPLNYDGDVKQLIVNLKFNQQLIAANILGLLLAQIITSKYQQATLPEAIIPVPLHHWRLRQRGFNQALEISKIIHQYHGIPVLKNHCKKIKKTKYQAQLNKKMREKNVKNVFTVRKKIPYQHVAIVDDVFTTGNTVHSLALTLKKHGVKQVDIWCTARAHY